jgi:hypothetical protein
LLPAPAISISYFGGLLQIGGSGNSEYKKAAPKGGLKNQFEMIQSLFTAAESQQTSRTQTDQRHGRWFRHRRRHELNAVESHAVRSSSNTGGIHVEAESVYMITAGLNIAQ